MNSIILLVGFVAGFLATLLLFYKQEIEQGNSPPISFWEWLRDKFNEIIK